jgi:hypothetical protein
MTNCSLCGKEITGKVYPNHTCQGCYNYFRNGGTVNKIPEAGVIEKDYRGYVVCHICGRAYKKLGAHLKESHRMTIDAYKEKFGLCHNARTTAFSYSEHMRMLADKYKMGQRLMITGLNTRIKTGENHLRLGKKARLQECIDKRRRTNRCRRVLL